MVRKHQTRNLEIPGSMPELGFTRVRQVWLSKSATADLDAHRPGMTVGASAALLTPARLPSAKGGFTPRA